MKGFTLSQFNREQWMAQKLELWHFDTGVTTVEERRERIREDIVRRRLADRVCYRDQGRPVTWAEEFKLCYGVELQTTETQFAKPPRDQR